MSRARRPVDPQAARVRALRRHFAEHNRLVLSVGVLTLMVTAALWYLLYALLFWLAALSAALRHGMDARPSEILPALFIYSAGLLVLLTWLAHRRSPNAAPRDDKGLLEMAADVLLAVPRATLAVWGNLSAWQRLTDRELAQAAELLDRLETERRIPLHGLPLELPDSATRLRILLALQLTELIRVSHCDGVTWLSRVPKRLLPGGN